MRILDMISKFIGTHKSYATDGEKTRADKHPPGLLDHAPRGLDGKHLLCLKDMEIIKERWIKSGKDPDVIAHVSEEQRGFFEY